MHGILNITSQHIKTQKDVFDLGEMWMASKDDSFKRQSERKIVHICLAETRISWVINWVVANAHLRQMFGNVMNIFYGIVLHRFYISRTGNKLNKHERRS